MEISKQSTKAFNVVFKSKRTFKLNSNLFLVQEVPVSKSWKRKIVPSFRHGGGLNAVEEEDRFDMIPLLKTGLKVSICSLIYICSCEENFPS
jgi:hypothetical protein